MERSDLEDSFSKNRRPFRIVCGGGSAPGDTHTILLRTTKRKTKLEKNKKRNIIGKHVCAKTSSRAADATKLLY